MPQNDSPEFKKKILRLRLEEGCTIHSITTEYGFSKESVRRWCRDFRKNAKPKAFKRPLLLTKRRL